MTVAEHAPCISLVPGNDEVLLRETVRGIAGGFGPSYYQEIARAGRAPTELWQALGEKGFLGVGLPVEHGGGGLGLGELAMVCEETAAVGCPLGLAAVSPGIVGTILARHGTGAQRRRWLPSIADATARIAFAMTEPDAGSNAHRIATSAVPVEYGYRITGQKVFISGADHADAVLVVARTGPRAPGRAALSLFLVDADAEGLSRSPVATAPEEPETQWIVHFDEVLVDRDRLVGEPGGGLRVVFDGLNPERILFGAIACGLARYALDKACAYARERDVWGVPIGAHQAIAHPLAEGKVLLDQARIATRVAAAAYDASLDGGMLANTAKFSGVKAARHCLDHAIQTHGGNGMAVEHQLANYWFLVRVLDIAPVSREMVLNFVAEHGLGLPRSY